MVKPDNIQNESFKKPWQACCSHRIISLRAPQDLLKRPMTLNLRRPLASMSMQARTGFTFGSEFIILQSTTLSSIGDTRCNVCLIQGARCSCRVEDFLERYEGDICGVVKTQYGPSLLRRACERKHKSDQSGEENRFGTHPPMANIPKGSSGISNGFIGGPYYGRPGGVQYSYLYHRYSMAWEGQMVRP